MTDQSIADVITVPKHQRGFVLADSTTLVENALYFLQVILFCGGSFVPAAIGALYATGQLGIKNDTTFYRS